MKKETYDVTGMSCAACSSRVEKAVAKQPGAQQVAVNLLKNSMVVEYDESQLSSAQIIAAVEKAGYGASLHAKPGSAPAAQTAETGGASAAQKAYSDMKKRLALSLLFTIPLFYLSMGHMMGWPLPACFLGMENAMTFAFTQFLLLLPIVYINRQYYIVGFKTLWQRSPNMDSLIALGSSAAIVYGIYAIYKIGIGFGQMDMDTVHTYMMELYFESAGTILTLITMGKTMEARAKGKTSDAITKLMDLAPKTATVERNGVESVIPVEEVQLGDVLIVKAGESVPVDGVVLEGTPSVDESALTGESIPVEKQAGDSVIGATINKSGYFKMRATKVGDDTALSQIVRLVDEATSSKAPIAKLADKVSGVFVPVVITIAVIATAAWLLTGHSVEFALSIGISVLVISCPCALVISVPLSFFAGIGAASKEGILFKGGTVMEALSNTKAAVLDKTGTLTEGKFKVRSIVKTAGQSEDEILALAAAGEIYSTHPIAQSIVTCANEKGLSLPKLTSMQEIAGHGVKAKQNGEDIYIGNEKLLALSGISVPSLPENKEVGTDVYVAKGKTLLGRITISDAIKSDTIEGIKDLKALDITPVMLTGDNEKSAKAIGSLVGIENIHAGLLPEDKLSEMQKVRKEIGSVLFVGDGINDAPVLAGADVGAAMGSGADAAIEAADVVFLNSNVDAISKAVRVARKVIKTAWENVAFALIVKIAVMIMGLLGYANMWVAVFADTGVTILCILYAVRLLRAKF